MSTKTVMIEFSPDMKRDNITFRELYRNTLHSKDDLEKLKICLEHDRKHIKENYGIPGYIVNRILNAIPSRVPGVWDRVDIMVASEYAELQYTLKQPTQDESISGIFVEYPPNTNRSLKMITRQSLDTECRDDSVFSLFVKQQFSDRPDCDVFYAYNNYAILTFGNKKKTEQEDTMDKNMHSSTSTVVLQLATKLNITKEQTYRTKLATPSDVHGWLLDVRQNRIVVSAWHAIPQPIFAQVKTAILLLTAGRRVTDISIEITDTSVTLVYYDRDRKKSTYQKGMFIDTPTDIEPLHNDTVVVAVQRSGILNNDMNAAYRQYVNQLFIDFPNYTMFYGYKNYAFMTMPETTEDVPMLSSEVNSVFEQNYHEEEENMTTSDPVTEVLEPTVQQIHIDYSDSFAPYRSRRGRSWQFITNNTSVYYWQYLKICLVDSLGVNVSKITDRIYQMWKDDYQDLKFVLDDTGLTITSIGRHNFESCHDVFIQKPDDVTIPNALYLPTYFYPNVKTSKHYWLHLQHNIRALLDDATDSWDAKPVVDRIRHHLDGVPHVLSLRLTERGILVHIAAPVPDLTPDEQPHEINRIDLLDGEQNNRDTVFKNMDFTTGLIYLTGLAMIDPTAKALMEKYLKF